MKNSRIKAALIAVICSMVLPLNVMAAEPAATVPEIPDRIITENGYLEKVTDIPSEKSNIGVLRYQYKVVTSGGNLNVRDYPVTGNVIGSLKNGTIVDIPFMQPGWIPDGWLYMTSPIEGYVASQYIGNV